MRTIKLESGIPIPDKKTKATAYYPVADMKKGQSFTFAVKKYSSLSLVTKSFKAKGWTFITRKVNKKISRIWRVK